MSKKLKKITKANITHVSLVPKGANGIDFLIVKGEDTPTVTADIPILKVDEEQRVVTGVVYEPNVPDSQGDFMEADVIEKTAYAFMENHQNIDIKHNFKTNNQIKVIESYIAKNEETIGNKKVQPGTWVMSVKVNDDTVWEGVKKGDFNGFSMGGTGVKEEVQIKETPTSITKDEKGLLAMLKSYLLGENIEKAEQGGAGKSLIVSFKARAVNEKINEIHWALRDAIRSILQAPNIPNKKELVSQQIDEYKAYVLQELDTVGIKKMAEDLEEEPLTKAGKKISTANEEKLRAAYQSIGELLSVIDQNNQKEGEELDMEVNVTKEEFQELLKAAVQEGNKGIDKRLQVLEKGESPTQQEEVITKENIAEMIKCAVEEAMTQKIEIRGISNQLHPSNIQKQDNQNKEFSSVQI